MCGIIGCVNESNCTEFLLRGLELLEYRGYDSAGIALSAEEIVSFKSLGRIAELRKTVENENPKNNTGIGHTRWATHGEPSIKNAHPHFSPNRIFSIVHNGIIENSTELYSKYLNDFKPYSQTDTEIIAVLLEKFYNGNVVETITKVNRLLKGAYALGIICNKEPNTIYAVAMNSPLAVAFDNQMSAVASDVLAFEGRFNKAVYLKNGEISVLKQNDVSFYNANGSVIIKEFQPILSIGKEEKNDKYEHHMLREIYEQKSAVLDTFCEIQNNNTIFSAIDKKINLEKIDNIIISGCGSAYHVACVGKLLFEKYAKINSFACISSELRYGNSLINDKTLSVFISQSGETADTLASLRLAKQKGSHTVSIVNVLESAIAKESHAVIPTFAGREIAVATTKAFNAQLIAVYCLALYIANKKNSIAKNEHVLLFEEIKSIPFKIDSLLNDENAKIKDIAKSLTDEEHLYFIGRRTDFASALESALKVKEVSYIHSEACSAGELKHGSIALIDKNTVVFAFACEDELIDKIYSNIKEVEARGAKVFVVTKEKFRSKFSKSFFCFEIPEILSDFSVSLSVIPMQLLSYYIAYFRGCDIDKPKNLAKSVTVE